MLRKARTIVYVDGFNLYHGSLEGTKYRWLDIQAMVAKILNDNNEIVSLKYFTAEIDKKRYPDSASRQRIYLAALRKHTPNIEIIRGHFLAHEVLMPNADPPPRFCKVIKTEEKGSDVNLAVKLVRDAFLNHFDVAVVISNDSDLVGAVKIVKNEIGKVVGVILPLRPGRKGSKALSQVASFTREIRPAVLASSQLPDNIPGTNISKPKHWE